MTQRTSDLRPGGATMRPMVLRSATLFGSQLAGSLLTFGYTVLLARIATPADFGSVMSGFAAAVLISVALTLNIEAGSIRYLVRYRQSGDRRGEAGYLRAGQLIIVAVTTVAAVLTVTAASTGLIDLADPRVSIAVLALTAAPLIAVTRLYARHATAVGKVLHGNIPVLLVRPAVIFVLLVTLWLLDVRPGPAALMAQFLAAFFLAALLQQWLLRRDLAVPSDARPDFGALPAWLMTGATMAPLHLMRDNFKHVAVLSAGLTLVSAEVGYLAVALSFMTLLHFGVKSVDITASPQLSGAVQAGDTARARGLLAWSALLKLAVALSGFAFFAVLGPWAIGLFGDAYGVAYVPLLVLAAIPLADALIGPAQLVLNVSGRQSIVALVATIGGCLLVGGIAVGGLLAGPVGAGVGASLGYVAQQLLLRRACRRETGVETSALTIWRHFAQR